MTLEQALALLTDILANHKEDRSRIQKELGNLRFLGFEVKVVLNAKTTALVKDAERLLTKLTAVKAMQTIAGIQAETQQTDDVPQVVEAALEVIEETAVVQVDTEEKDMSQVEMALALEASDTAVLESAEPLQLDETEALSVALMEATAEAALVPVNTHSSGVRFDAKMAQLETNTEAVFEQVEALQSELVPDVLEAVSRGSTETLFGTAENLPPALSVPVLVESDAKPPTARTRLTEIMAQPDRPTTAEEEREFEMLEELFNPWVQKSVDDLGEIALPDIQPPSALLNSQSQAIQTAKSFESIVLVLVIIVLVFKAIITIIKAIEESEIAIAQAKNFEQMYAVVGRKVRHKVQGFAVA